jgi:hypothetical protein
MDLVPCNLVEIFTFVKEPVVSVFSVRLKGATFHKTVMLVVTAEGTFIFEK